MGLCDEEGRVGVVADVVFLDAVLGKGVVDEAAEEGDVGADADLAVEVTDGGGASEARVDGNELGIAISLGFHDPAEADGVIFGGVSAHGKDDIGVGDVVPAVGHGTASEGGGQTGHRGAVSNPGLLFEWYDAESGAEGFDEEVVVLVGVGAAADDGE